MEKLKTARVIVLKEQAGGLTRISTYDNVTEIDAETHHTVLYIQENATQPKRIIGIIPDNFVIRVNWDDEQ